MINRLVNYLKKGWQKFRLRFAIQNFHSKVPEVAVLLEGLQFPANYLDILKEGSEKVFLPYLAEAHLKAGDLLHFKNCWAGSGTEFSGMVVVVQKTPLLLKVKYLTTKRHDTNLIYKNVI